MITLPNGRKIGTDQKPYIIAEIGSNWRTETDCMTAISLMRAHGADAVKFQFFTSKDLYGRSVFIDESQPDGPGRCPYLDPSWLPRLAQKAKNVGIDFLCTAFSPEGYALVNPHVHMHKVASCEAGDIGILKTLRDLGKPVLLSTGGQHFDEVDHSLRRLGEIPVVLMHCVVAYPVRAARLGRILALADTFGRPVGYSDHTTSADSVPLAALQAGACVIEKHVTTIKADTPDSPHSLTADEFGAMVKTLQTGATPDANQVSPEEREAILKHKRRLKATRAIKAGEKLEWGVNFGSFRSLTEDAHALPPRRAFEHEGKPGAHGQVAKRALRPGDGIGPGDF